jgi:hypothetical protein
MPEPLSPTSRSAPRPERSGRPTAALRGGVDPRPGRDEEMGEAAGSQPGRYAVDEPTRGSAEASTDRTPDRLGWHDAPVAFHGADRRARGLRRRDRSSEGHCADGSVDAGDGPGSSLRPRRCFANARSGREEGYAALRDASTRTEPGVQWPGHAGNDPEPLRTARRSSPRNRARRPSRTRSWPTSGREREAPRSGPPTIATSTRADSSRRSRTRPERTRHRHPRRLPRGVPQPAGHRRRYRALTYVGLVPASLIGST